MLVLKTIDGDGREWTVEVSQTPDDVVHIRTDDGRATEAFRLPMPVALAVAGGITAEAAGAGVEWSA